MATSSNESYGGTDTSQNVQIRDGFRARTGAVFNVLTHLSYARFLGGALA
jgi:hypothetical protein